MGWEDERPPETDRPEHVNPYITGLTAQTPYTSGLVIRLRELLSRKRRGGDKG
jgi:hypothetical protein